MTRMQGKVVVILGASGARSMGAATARRFAREGAKLILAARRLDKLKPIAAEVGGTAIVADITKEDDLVALAEHAHALHGRLDAAINYAGVNSSAPIAEVTRQALQQACDVHIIGTALFIKHMGARMGQGGSIVTTSTLTALLAPPGLAAYAATKRGADQIVRIAAVELGPRGIRVNAIAPGFTRSEMTEGYFAIPTLERAFCREIPLGRLGSVEDVANVALWLASDESASTTGQVIDVTSGQSLRRTPTKDEMMS
jgi:NAD(P)-dependent dehydrogenase (short-subunit alcohol dehydrogenase family)